MGDLGIDTEVRACGDGRYEGTVSDEWEIWGPMGGYVAAFALRAAGLASEHPRPAAFSCHYLGVARFAPVQLRVELRKRGRNASSYRVDVAQDDVFFTREGGEAYLKDLPDAEMHRLDSGHFAVEDSLSYIAENMRRFYREKVSG